jgi:alpha-beta hydrolase superfamily lysophospholipase
MLRLLAEGLAARGIASVRMDKRGIGASRVEGFREGDVTLEDFVDDLERVAAAVMSRGDLGPFVLVGHSEGALISTLLSRRRQPDGLVLVSAPGRPLGEVMQEQLEARLPETLRPVALGLLAQLKAGQLVTDVPRELLPLFRPSVQPFLISALCVNPAEHVKAVDAPVLIVSGEHDLQVTAEDHTQLTAARPEARSVRIAAMNHALRAAPPDPAGNAALYGRADLPLAPGLVDTIAKFISALPNSARPAAAHAACDR